MFSGVRDARPLALLLRLRACQVVAANRDVPTSGSTKFRLVATFLYSCVRFFFTTYNVCDAYPLWRLAEVNDVRKS